MRLFHFSDNPNIASFEPRPVRIPSKRRPGQEWLNGSLVWAIDEEHDFLYLFPRDCPRILIWTKPQTSQADRQHWLGDWRAAAFIERRWHGSLRSTTIYRHEMPPGAFESLNDAGMWIARETVIPIGCAAISQLQDEFRPRNIDLRVIDTLRPLKDLSNTSLHTSGIRLRNAQDWT